MKLRIPLVLLICLQLIGTAYASQFRASAVEVDITPSTPQWLAGYSARQSDVSPDCGVGRWQDDDLLCLHRYLLDVAGIRGQS